MKETKGKIAFALVCAVLGLIITMQYKAVKTTTEGGFLSTQRANQLALEIRGLRTEKERLNQELTGLERRLKEYEQTEADENYIIRNLKNDLEKFQVLAGYRSIEGPGVIVNLEDAPTEYTNESSHLVFNYEYILNLVNKLNAAGAEAIAINDQRYMANTEIYFSSNALLINGVPVTPPFQIKAIGNPDALEGGLNMRFGIVWSLKQDINLKISVKKHNNIVMPRHTRVTNFKFAKPIDTIE